MRHKTRTTGNARMLTKTFRNSIATGPKDAPRSRPCFQMSVTTRYAGWVTRKV